MKRTLGLALAALMLMPGSAFAQNISAAAVRPVAPSAPTIAPQAVSAVPAALTPATSLLAASPSLGLTAAPTPGLAAAAPLLQAHSAIVKPGADAAPALVALFEGGRSPDAAPAVSAVSAPAPLALAASRLAAPSISPRGPSAPRKDSERAPWRRKISEYKRGFVSWVSRTPSEIFLVGLLGLGIGAGLGHHQESAREKHIPLGFSEIHQIERDAERAGMAVGPLTRYLTSANDMTMKVFEAWNESHAATYAGSNVRRFALELEYKMEPTYKFHRYELFDFVRDLPAQADAATASLDHLARLRRGLAPVLGDFDRAWDDSHSHHYRTEVYLATVTDSEGNSHTELRTREVYDHTTHSYTYDAAAGERASAEAEKLVAGTKSLAVDVIRTASQTNAEGEYAAERSRKAQGGPRPDQDRLTAIANTWATGSTLSKNLPVIGDLWTAFQKDAAAWRTAKSSARNARYDTGSRSDAGPAEFQVVEKALADGAGAATKIGEILDGIAFARDGAPKLEAMIRELIDVELHYKKDGADSKKLMREILTLSQQIYRKNFTGGFDVIAYRNSVVLAFAAFGLVLGAGLGLGLDAAARRYRWY